MFIVLAETKVGVQTCRPTRTHHSGYCLNYFITKNKFMSFSGLYRDRNWRKPSTYLLTICAHVYLRDTEGPINSHV